MRRSPECPEVDLQTARSLGVDGSLQLVQEAAPGCTQNTCLEIVEDGPIKLLSAPFRVDTDNLPVQTPETTVQLVSAIGLCGFSSIIAPLSESDLGIRAMACTICLRVSSVWPTQALRSPSGCQPASSEIQAPHQIGDGTHWPSFSTSTPSRLTSALAAGRLAAYIGSCGSNVLATGTGALMCASTTPRDVVGLPKRERSKNRLAETPTSFIRGLV